MKTQPTLLTLVTLSLMLANEGRTQGTLMPAGAPAATIKTLEQIEPRHGQQQPYRTLSKCTQRQQPVRQSCRLIKGINHDKTVR